MSGLSADTVLVNEYMNKAQQSTKHLTLDTPIQFVKGVGPARAKAFEQLGVKNVSDVLEYFPREWVFAPELIKIEQIKPEQTVTIMWHLRCLLISSLSRI